MTSQPSTLRIALAALLVTAAAGWAGDFASQSSFGDNFFNASPPCPVKQFPTFEAIAPVPAIVDPFAQDFIPVFCQIQVSREGNGVKKAKGNYSSELIVLNNRTGEAETFDLGSGKFSTNKDGRDNFDFELPAELFADGFESGDVSAWSYTRADFSNRKKANNVSMSCGTSSSKGVAPADG